MFESKRVLLFDLDGTLIDSVPDLTKALKLMLDELNMPSFDENIVRGWVGNGASILVKRALLGKRDFEESELDSEFFNDALKRFMAHYSKVLNDATGLYPDVKDTLQELRNRDYRMAIITNKPSQFVSPILENLKIESLFESIVGGDDLPKKKPEPEPLLYSCEVMGVSTDVAVMIGDSSNDILSAKRAGVSSIAVSYGYNYDNPIDTLGANIVIDSFRELLDYFKGCK